MSETVLAIPTAPAGPRIGAFFDLDGTLVDGFTPVPHARHRIRHRQSGVGEVLGIVEAAVRYRLGRMTFDRLVVRAAGYLRGDNLADLEELGEQLFHRDIKPLLFAEMVALVVAHQRRGHTVVLCSSALTMHANPVARFLGIDQVICNHFGTDAAGTLTGTIRTPIIWGAGKARAVAAFSAEHRLALAECYFYADGDEEVPLMRVVGHPRPVNPRPGLAAAAAAGGWPVLRPVSRRRRWSGRA